jgi:uncharacterized protein YllA (UPF0747 family)
MKFTEDVRKYAAEQGIAEEEALKKGMEEKSKEFVEKGAEVGFAKSNTLLTVLSFMTLQQLRLMAKGML